MGANTDIETSKGHKIVDNLDINILYVIQSSKGHKIVDNLDINLYIISTCIITSHHFRIARATSCHDKQLINKHYGECD